MQKHVKYALGAAVAALFISGCGSSSNHTLPATASSVHDDDINILTLTSSAITVTDDNNVSLNYVDTYSISDLAQGSYNNSSTALRGWFPENPGILNFIYNAAIAAIKQFKPDVANYTKRYKVTFSGKDGEPESGMLMVPCKDFACTTPVSGPLIAIARPTDPERANAPSTDTKASNPTIISATMYAAAGYTVFAPDFKGMGINNQIHPYCIKDELAQSTVQMYKTVKGLNDLNVTEGLSLVGYSEGGYTTLATAQYINENEPDIDLHFVMPLDGATDLNGTMQHVMVSADAEFPTPYFFPMVIAGYSTYYPSVSEVQFENVFLKDPMQDTQTFAQALFEMMKGYNTPAEINALMREVDGYSGPLSTTYAAFQEEIQNPDSNVSTLLSQNSAIRGNWEPQAQTQYHFVHYNYDELVPSGNAKAAQKLWGSGSYVDYVSFDIYESLDPLSAYLFRNESKHVQAYLDSYIKSLIFILNHSNSENLTSVDENALFESIINNYIEENNITISEDE